MAKDKRRSTARICFDSYKKEFIKHYGEQGYKLFKTKIFGELMHKVNDTSTDVGYKNRGEKALYLEANYLEKELQKVLSPEEFSLLVRKGVADMIENEMHDMRGDWRDFNQAAVDNMRKHIAEDELKMLSDKDAYIDGGKNDD